MSDLRNLTIITSADREDIFQGLAELGASSASFTNGTYTAPASIVVPTTLAGFQFAADRTAEQSDVFVMAINSNVSMQEIARKKAELGEDIGEVEDQETRARKVLEPLAAQFPNRKIVGVFYDEDTPTPLYEFLESNTPVTLSTLFKFGYGTNPKAGIIEGANCFNDVVAFPFPSDAKALCHNITTALNGRENYALYKLTEEKTAEGQPYMNKDNQILFKLEGGLEEYAAVAKDINTQDNNPEAPNKSSSPTLGLNG